MLSEPASNAARRDASVVQVVTLFRPAALSRFWRATTSLGVAATSTFRFNVQSFRSNVVLRWEWRAGSTLYLVWQQDRSARETFGRRATVGDMFSSLRSTGDHFFVVKASFWFSPS